MSVIKPYEIPGVEQAVMKVLADAMTKAAEPLIQKALADAEQAMRAGLAITVLAIAKEYSIQTRGERLEIRVVLGADATTRL
jgi:hypothetical protein